MNSIRRCDFALCRCPYPFESTRSQYCSDSCRAKDHLRKKGKAYQGPPLADEQADRLSIQLNRQAHWKLSFGNPALLEQISQQQEEINQMRARLDALGRQEKQAWDVCYPTWSKLCHLVFFPKKAEGLSSQVLCQAAADLSRSETATAFEKVMAELTNSFGSFVEQYTQHQQEEALQKELQELAHQVRPLLTTAVGLSGQKSKLYEQLEEKYFRLQKQVRRLNREEPRKRNPKARQTPPQSAPVPAAPQVVTPTPVAGKYRSAKDIMQQQGGEPILLEEPLSTFLGKLERQYLSMTLTGNPGGGKSHFCLILAKAFCEKGLKVLFYSLEEGCTSEVFKAKLIRYDLAEDSLFYAEDNATLAEVKQAATEFDVIILDSWTLLPDADGKAFGQLSKQFPRLVLISIFQLTSGREIRGGNQPVYDSFINLEVKDGIACNRKNRFGGKGEFNIFNP